MSIIKYISIGLFTLIVIIPQILFSQGTTTLVIPATNPNNPIGDYIARDKIVALPGTKFIANSTDKSHLYLDKNIITLSNAGIFPVNGNSGINSNSPYIIDKNLPVGVLKGGLNVNNGQVQYSIPINIAPATSGVAPNISLSYNSSVIDGIAGFGWQIGGISAITRMQYDFYHTNSVRPIALDGTDFFALDGNLIYGEAPTFSSDQSQRLENDDFTNVRRINNGESFLVISKNGNVIEYGNSTDSRLLVNNPDNSQPASLVYYINKVTDKQGNYYTYHYYNQNGEIAVKEIKYTGNDGASIIPYNSVKFYYDERIDKNVKYFKGNKLTTSLILREIEVFAEGQSFKRYTTKYNVIEGKSYLTSITEHGHDNTELNPTIFEYELSDAPDFYGIHSEDVPLNQLPSLADYKTGDFNGDGKSDILAYNYSSVNGADGARVYSGWGLYINQNDGTSYNLVASFTGNFFPYSYYGVNSQFSPNAEGVNSINLNGDDKEDALFLQNDGTNSIYTPQISNGNGFTQGVSFSLPVGAKPIFADINGDKIPELIAYEPNTGYINIWNFKTNLMQTRNAHNSVVDPEFSIASIFQIMQVVDYDGDGIQELLVEISNKARVLKVEQYFENNGANASNFIFKSLATDYKLPQTLPPYITEDFYADFNGDGLTDNLTRGTVPTVYYPAFVPNNYFLRYNTSKFDASNASFFNYPTTYMANTVSGLNDINNKLLIIDMNNDGKMDVVTLSRSSTSSVSLYVSYGGDIENKIFIGTLPNDVGFPDVIDYKYYLGETYNTNGNYLSEFIIGDFDGDSYTDIMFKNTTSNYAGQRTIIYGQPSITTGKLARVTNGFNRTIKIKYHTLAKGNIYTKGTGATYPFVDIQSPLKVVSTIETQDALDNFYSINYKYEGAKIHLHGKGFLGFDKITVTDNLQQTKSITEYALNTEYAQRIPVNSKTYLFSNLTLPITETQNVYSFVYSNGSASVASALGHHIGHYIKLDSKLSADYTHNVFINSNYTYDNYLNLTEEISSINSGYKLNKTTYNVEQTNLYGNYYPSFVNEITTEQTLSGKPPIINKTKIDYFTNGLINKVTNNYTKPCSNFTQYIYEPNTGVTLSSLINGVRNSQFEYDSKYRFVTKTTNPLGYSETAVYDNRYGVPIKTTDITNLTTTYKYDGFGRNTSVTTPDNLTTSSEIKWYETNDDISGDPFLSGTAPLIVTKSIAPNSPVISNFITGSGLNVKSIGEGFNQNFVSNLSVFNEKGQLTTSKANYLIPCANPNAVLTTYNQYDELNRLIATTVSDGNLNPTSSIVYNTTGGSTSVQLTTPSGQTKTTITDAVGLTRKVTDHIGNILWYDYYSDGALKETQLAGNTVSSNTYDDCGSLSTQDENHHGITAYSYDNLGQLLSQTNNGHTYNYVYDIAGRSTSFTGPEGAYINTYRTSGNGKGLIEQETAPNGSLYKYYYDNLNRLVKKETTFNGQTYANQLAYDQYSNVTQYTYPSGFKVKSIYNSLGYLPQIKDETNNKLLWQGNEINHLGEYNLFTLGNGKQTTKTYNNFGYLTNENAGVAFDYSYDFNVLNGNLNYWQDNNKNLKETFTYDAIDRLKTATVGDLIGPSTTIPPLTLNYDDAGNITTKSDIGNYKYNSPTKPNQVNAVQNTNALISNITQDITYNAFDKIQNIVEGGESAIFEYGPDQGRIKAEYANALGTKTRLYLDDYEKETDGLNTREIHYISSPNGLIANYVIENGVANTYFIYSDYLGSPKTITNANGNTIYEQNFDAWGQRRNPNTWDYSATPLPPSWLYRGFTGHEHLPQYSLINMNGRLYDPQNGRMLQADPVLQDPSLSQNYNRYSYALNNPLKFTDPSGYVYADPINDVNLYMNLNGRGWSGLSMHQNAPSGGGFVDASGELHSNDKLIAEAHELWKRNDQKEDYWEMMVHYKDGIVNSVTDAQVVGYRSDAIYEHLSKKSLPKEQSFDDAIGSAFFGSIENYRAIKNNSGDDNPYMYTYQELQDAATVEAEILSMFVPVGEIFQALKIGWRGLNIFSKSGTLINEGTNVVYQGIDKAGIVRYVGITEREAAVRFSEHLSSGTAKSLLQYRVVDGAVGLSRTGARVWEQTLINQYGLQKNGGMLLNKINSIAPKNWAQFGIK